MKKITLVFTLMTLCFSASTFSCEDHAVVTTQRDDGTKIGLVVPNGRLKDAPVWKPEDGEPPLSITAARDAVLKWAKDEYSRYDSVEISEISLKRSGYCSSGEYWFYVFDLRPVIDGNTLWGGGNWAAVLMDETVIGTTELD
jgi:hypothetical protein